MNKRVRFRFENRTYEVEVERLGDRLTVTGEGQSFRVTLLPEAVEKIRPEERLQGRIAQVAAYSPEPLQAALPTAAGGSPGVSGGGVLAAPMTGVVKEIKVAPGHSVEAGQVVLIMEAMKMDIDVPAVAAGVVAEVSVRPGDNVEARQQLMVIA
jgi:geranyl-CoA carboxylase alpha subunit